MWVSVGLGWDDSQISNFQTELSHLGSLKFYHVPTDLGVPPWGWVGVGVGVGVGWWAVSTNLKSSNRIVIS